MTDFDNYSTLLMDEFAEIDELLYGEADNEKEADDDDYVSEDSDETNDEDVDDPVVPSLPSTSHVDPNINLPSTSHAPSNSPSLVSLERSAEDLKEEEIIERRYSINCCSLKCTTKIPRDVAVSTRQSMMELTKVEHDMLIKSHLIFAQHDSQFDEIYQSSLSKHHQKEWSKRSTHRILTQYQFRQIPICQPMYLFLYCLSLKKYKNIRNHFKEFGVATRVHKLIGKVPARRTKLYSETDCKDVVQFITAYADKHALPLPGRLPNLKNYDVMKLPSYETKKTVYEKYYASCITAKKNPMGRRIFLKTWQKYCPNITSMRPATDLCELCQSNNVLIHRAQNTSDEHKTAALQEAMNHLERAKIQRQHYQQIVQEAKQNPASMLVLAIDFAQNTVYPSSAQTVGAAYFKSARKVSLFGIHNEGTGQQYTFLIDEAHSIGKGPNSVVSMLDYILGIERKFDEVHIFADNCVSQNKNNTMMHYLDWRVRTNQNKKITMNFLLVGHTRFSPDRIFGLIKLKYTKATIDTFAELVQCVVDASPGGHSCAVPMYDPTTNRVFVSWYDWDHFLAPSYNRLVGITKYHHFTFTDNNLEIQCQIYADSACEAFTLLSSEVPTGRPVEIKAAGLSTARKWYLFKEVRPLCSNPDKRDDFIKKPRAPLPMKKKGKPVIRLAKEPAIKKKTRPLESAKPSESPKKRGRPRKNI